MRESFKSGSSFGVASGIITTLGLVMGLSTGTHSIIAVIGGILSIAIADGLSESTAMHISRKSENKDVNYVRESTFSTLVSKFFITLTFGIPFFLMDLYTAMKVDVLWGLFLTALISYLVSPKQKWEKGRDIFEHLVIVAFVVVVTYYAGEWIHAKFS